MLDYRSVNVGLSKSKVPFLPSFLFAEILLDLERQAAAAAKIQGDLKEPCDSEKVRKSVATRKMKILGFLLIVFGINFWLMQYLNPKKKLSKESNIKTTNRSGLTAWPRCCGGSQPQQ